MLICHTIFYCELFSWYNFLAECEILNFADVCGLTRTVSLLDDHLTIISRTAWYYWSCQFFYLNILYHQYSIVCVLSGNIFTNLLLQNPCWLASILLKVCFQR